MEPLLVFPDPVPPELAQCARPGRLPVEGRRRRGRPGGCRARATAGRGPSWWRPTTPRVPSRCAGRCASATCPSSRCCCWSSAPSWPTSSCATTSSTTSASTRSSPASSRPGSSTSSGAPVAAPAPSWSSTATCSSTSRPTRRPSPASRSTSPTWSTSCSSSWPRTPARCSPARRCSRRVWGYEYYGGARTVDVHIRRLRAKLGEEHANLIQTVRSVGYRFGQSRWGV